MGLKKVEWFWVYGFPLAVVRLLLFYGWIAVIFYPTYLWHQLRPLSIRQRIRMRRLCLRYGMWILGFRVRRSGMSVAQANSLEGALFVCNHRSWSDPMIALIYLNAIPVSKAEVRDYPVIGKGMEFAGILYLRRRVVASLKEVRHSIYEYLRKGGSILLFPEGTTYTGELTRTFKKGAFEEAARAGGKVCPMVIEYRDRHANYWDVRPLWKQFVLQCGKWRNPCAMWIGEPLESEDAQLLRTSAKHIIDQKIREMHHDPDRYFPS